jgi:hypothetical protein
MWDASGKDRTRPHDPLTWPAPATVRAMVVVTQFLSIMGSRKAVNAQNDDANGKT